MLKAHAQRLLAALELEQLCAENARRLASSHSEPPHERDRRMVRADRRWHRGGWSRGDARIHARPRAHVRKELSSRSC